jgi:Big-like domain-containing protein
VKPGPVDIPPHVMWVEPEDGAEGVLCDSVVLVRFSQPIDPESLGSLRWLDADGEVPARYETSPDRRVLIAHPERPLVPCTPHVVRIDGLRDGRGRPVPSFESRFVSGPVTFGDIAGV